MLAFCTEVVEFVNTWIAKRRSTQVPAMVPATQATIDPVQRPLKQEEEDLA